MNLVYNGVNILIVNIQSSLENAAFKVSGLYGDHDLHVQTKSAEQDTRKCHVSSFVYTLNF